VFFSSSIPTGVTELEYAAMRSSKHPFVRVGRNLIYGLVDPCDNCLRYIGKTHKRRENRLSEHVEAALEGSPLPVHQWIRGLLACGLSPEIFILERTPPELDWRWAEIAAIERWRNWQENRLPYTHPPQTWKSMPTLIEKVELLNIAAGG
jgi:hypothetical protein